MGRFGNTVPVQEASREVWIARYWSEFWQDLRYGVRTLVSQPRFSVPAMLALVLGIGVNAVLFNVYNAMALAPYAVREPSRVVQVLSERGGNRWGGVPWVQFRYLQQHSQSLEGLAAHSGAERAQITYGQRSWFSNMNAVSENYFDLIGTGFTLGRGFLRGEKNGVAPAPEVVLNHDTWVTQFGSDPEIVGKWLDVSGQRLQVAGVTARGFNGPSVEVVPMWIPAGWRDILHPGWDSLTNPDFCCFSIVGRMKPDSSRSEAQAEMNTLSAQFLQSIHRQPARIVTTRPSFLANPGRIRQASAVFLIMAAATVLILLLACANVANLQLARATSRSHEIAVRYSLGAGYGRILRQMIVESLLISSVAGLISSAISISLPASTLRLLTGPEARLSFRFENDWRVVVFIIASTVIAAMLFGLAPAFSAIREGVGASMRTAGRVASRNPMRALLLGAQIALCAILLSCAALLARALDRVRHMDMGFRYDNVITMTTGLDASGMDDVQGSALLRQLLHRISALPGVEAAAWAATIPLGNANNLASIQDPRGGGRISVGSNSVSANFFELLNIPFLAGRTFSRTEETGDSAVIVSQATAERLWPGEGALGKTLIAGKPLAVIGIVKNFETRGFGSKENLGIWLASKGGPGSQLLIRYTGNPAPLLAELPRLARRIDRRLPGSASHYSTTIAESQRAADASARIGGALGMLALLLAGVGVYGVAAYSVSQRWREVGIRVALGARPSTILSMMLRENMRPVGLGVIAGMAGAIAFGRLLSGLLYGVPPTDPVALGGAIILLAALAVLATLGPAQRASRVDPAVTLRHE